MVLLKKRQVCWTGFSLWGWEKQSLQSAQVDLTKRQSSLKLACQACSRLSYNPEPRVFSKAFDSRLQQGEERCEAFWLLHQVFTTVLQYWHRAVTNGTASTRSSTLFCFICSPPLVSLHFVLFLLPLSFLILFFTRSFPLLAPHCILLYLQPTFSDQPTALFCLSFLDRFFFSLLFIHPYFPFSLYFLSFTSFFPLWTNSNIFTLWFSVLPL